MKWMPRKGFLSMGSICLDLQLLAVIIHQCATIWHALEIGHAWDPRTLQDQSMSDPQAHRHTGANPPTQSYSFLASKCCQFSLHSIHLWNPTQDDGMFECRDMTHWRTKHINDEMDAQKRFSFIGIHLSGGATSGNNYASMCHDLIGSRNPPRLRS